MAITISSESASYYSAGSYRSSLQKSSSDHPAISGGYYNTANAASVKDTDTTKSVNNEQAATYDKATALYDYAKSNLELSKLSLFDSEIAGQISVEPSANTGSQQMPDSIGDYDALENTANSGMASALEHSNPKDLYSPVIENNSAYKQNAFALQQNISNYTRAENNYQSTLRIFDASV